MTITATAGDRAERDHRITLGISSCLLGAPVRYDGNHKKNAYITETLGRVFDFFPCCPETAIGLGVPRPPIRLVATAKGVRARGVDDPQRDVTADLADYGHRMASELRWVSGYIFKKGSPSCGMVRVPRYAEDGRPAGGGVGVFAGAVMERLPELPVEEEGRLMNPVLRENFVERVFVYHRWQALSASGLTAEALIDFHTRHKFILLAHDETVYREIGRLVSGVGSGDLAGTAGRYIRMMMNALKKPATTRTHANVLMHILGFFKNRLDTDDKAELLEAIDEYRRGLVPLVVPITLIRHHLRSHPDGYIARQHYLVPHPRELMLRNLI